jgi:hypothetical protein
VVIEGHPKVCLVRTPSPEPQHQSVPNEINVLRSGRRLRAVRDRNELGGTVPGRNGLALRQMVDVGGSPISAENLWRAPPAGCSKGLHTAKPLIDRGLDNGYGKSAEPR